MGNPTPVAATPQLDPILIDGAEDLDPGSNVAASWTPRSRFRIFAMMLGLCVRTPQAQSSKAAVKKYGI